MAKNEFDACTGCLSRRAFVTKAAAAAALAALAACAGSDLTAPTSIGSTIKISDHSELANVGGVASFTWSGTPVAVVRTGDDSFIALSRICTHQGSTVSSNGNGFTCPNHGAMFSKTGSWVGGQPTTNLHTYPVSYDAAKGTLAIG